MAAAAERGGFVLLIGGSSVGKTRCAAEAVRALLPDWWLVHPAGPGEVAALAAAPPARTVVWLDELQRYLDGEHGLTGGVVRALLNAPGPVVIIGTLWPDRYAAYTTVPGARRRGSARAGTARCWTWPRSSASARSSARQSRTGPAPPRPGTRGCGRAGRGRVRADPDPGRRAAAGRPLGGRPGPRSPYAWAVLTAALDAARLGARAPLSADLLRAAAPGYCTSAQQAEAPDNWFEQALAYATAKLHGAAAALSPAGAGMGQVAGYTVADYLLQHASRERRSARVPASTWDALLSHIRDPADAARLADSARAGCCTATPSRCTVTPPTPSRRRARRRAAGRAAGRARRPGRAARPGRRRRRGRRRAAGRAAGRARRPGRGRSCAPGPTPATGTPPGGWPSCWPSAATWTGCAPGPTPATGRRRPLARPAGRARRPGRGQILRARADAGDWARRRSAGRAAGRARRPGRAARPGRRRRRGRRQSAGRAAGRARRPGRGHPDPARPGRRRRRDAARRLAGLLASAATWTGPQILRARADAGDGDAAGRLAELLAERGDLDGLRARADAGDGDAASRLAGLLAERGDLDGAIQILRARADAGDGDAGRLAELLTQQGRGQEAERLRRFGLNLDGSVACG